MVDIVVGNVPPVIRNVPQRQKNYSSGVEVQVLNVRAPRKQRVPSSTEERRKGRSQDPAGSHILTILLPSGHPLPEDLGSGRYRVTLHVTRKNV